MDDMELPESVYRIPQPAGTYPNEIQACGQGFGREYLAVAMYSKTFQTALQIFPDEHWLLPFHRIDANRDSLRIFALIRRLPTYDTTTAANCPNLLGDWTTTMKMLINNPGSGSDPQMRYFCVCRTETSTKRGSKGRLGEDQIVKEPMYGRGLKEITATPL